MVARMVKSSKNVIYEIWHLSQSQLACRVNGSERTQLRICAPPGRNKSVLF